MINISDHAKRREAIDTDENETEDSGPLHSEPELDEGEASDLDVLPLDRVPIDARMLLDQMQKAADELAKRGYHPD